jgi:pimeloyl-ACP methyl ester carboxylesterase
MVYQAIGSAGDARRYPPSGQLVSVGDYRLHLNCVGEGSPTVILETMSGGMSAYWAWIQPEVAKKTRVCAYDRAGRGWSDPGATPRDLWGTAEDLYTLLQNAGIDGPYVPVGHSIGGLYVRALATQHPNEVVGMVLVDAVHPEDFDRYPEIEEQGKTYSRITAFFPALARIGLFRLYFEFGGEIDFPDLPAQQHAEVASFWSSPAYFQNSRAEGQMSSAIRKQGQALPDLGDMPLVVISAGINSPNWTTLQAELPLLSTNSRHITVEDAMHSSLALNPDHAQQTSAAILQVVEAAKTGDEIKD